MVERTIQTSTVYCVFNLIDDKDFVVHLHDIVVRCRVSIGNDKRLQYLVSGIQKVDSCVKPMIRPNTSIYTKFAI